MVAELIGMIGGALIILAWILETAEGVRKHKSIVDLRFSAIFFVATILLTVYSWQRADMVFFYLNIILMAILVIEILYSIHVKKVHKK